MDVGTRRVRARNDGGLGDASAGKPVVDEDGNEDEENDREGNRDCHHNGRSCRHF